MKRVHAAFAMGTMFVSLHAAAPLACGADRPRMVLWSPALAAIAFEIGLGSKIVGITQWTRLPPGETRPIVGDAHSVYLEALHAVRPNIVVLQGEPPAGLRATQRLWPTLRIERVELEQLADIPRAARRLHELADDTSHQLSPLTEEFERAIQHYRSRAQPPQPPRVLFLIGTDRPLAAGPQTFVGEMIELAGGQNAGVDLPGRTRWKVASIEHLWAARPDLLIVHAPEPECAAAQDWWRKRWTDAALRVPRIFGVSDPSWVQPSLRTITCLTQLTEWVATTRHSTPTDSDAAPPSAR